MSIAVESAPMKTYPSSLRLMSWITIAALLTMLWSGTVSAVTVDATSLTPWGDICSVNGADAGTSGADHHQNGLHVHCAFCCKQSAAYILPSRFDLLLAVPAEGALPVEQKKTAITPSAAWPTLPPRGPPAIH